MRVGLSFSRRVAWAQGLVLIGLLLSLTASTLLLIRKEAKESVLRRFDYVSLSTRRAAEIRPEWRPRIASTALARSIRGPARAGLGERIAEMFAALFFATGLIYIALDRRAAPLLLLGTFAALYYCTTPLAENTWYPWDMPALFFGAVTLWLAMRRSVAPLAVVILVATTFKETLAVMALFYLFYEGRTLRWRAAWSSGVVLAGVVLRLVIEHSVGGPVQHTNFLHVSGNPREKLRVLDNLKYLLSGNVNHVVWTNVGLWLLVFVIPSRDPVLSGFRWIALALYVGLFAAGSFNEFRVFLEVLPGSLLLLHQLFATPLQSLRAEAGPEP